MKATLAIQVRLECLHEGSLLHWHFGNWSSAPVLLGLMQTLDAAYALNTFLCWVRKNSDGNLKIPSVIGTSWYLELLQLSQILKR